MLDLSRRSFLGSLAAVIAAPYVVRSGILMPVKKIILPEGPMMILEGSADGVNWFPLITRPDFILRPAVAFDSSNEDWADEIVRREALLPAPFLRGARAA